MHGGDMLWEKQAELPVRSERMVTDMDELSQVRFDGSRRFRLDDVRTDDTGRFRCKEDSTEDFRKNLRVMVEEQGKLYAQGRTALLLIFQGMDAAGKDGLISHVMSGLNPQGTQVHSFKQPTAEELSHDYLWRVNQYLPAKGKIGIFNRSYYEEVLVVRVHNLIGNEKIPDEYAEKIWDRRFEHIRGYEKYLRENGVIPVKFFLNISKDEQKKRLLSRIDNQSKNWKFSEDDIRERRYWNDYQKCYEETIEQTAAKEAPWYVIPADKKWYARYMVSSVIVRVLESLDLQYPELSGQQKELLEKYRVLLDGNDGL